MTRAHILISKQIRWNRIYLSSKPQERSIEEEGDLHTTVAALALAWRLGEVEDLVSFRLLPSPWPRLLPSRWAFGSY
jgi:hypothetical protein